MSENNTLSKTKIAENFELKLEELVRMLARNAARKDFTNK